MELVDYGLETENAAESVKDSGRLRTGDEK